MAVSEAPRARLRVGRWAIPVPRHRAARIALGVVMLVRGLIPTPTSPLLLSASVTLLSMDVARLRRWRRQTIVWLGRRRRGKGRQTKV